MLGGIVHLWKGPGAPDEQYLEISVPSFPSGWEISQL